MGSERSRPFPEPTEFLEEAKTRADGILNRYKNPSFLPSVNQARTDAYMYALYGLNQCHLVLVIQGPDIDIVDRESSQRWMNIWTNALAHAGQGDWTILRNTLVSSARETLGTAQAIEESELEMNTISEREDAEAEIRLASFLEA